MSGFFGIVNKNGAPPDRKLVDALLQSLAFRGPDSSRSVTMGQVALGHSLLRTGDWLEDVEQPFTVDGQLWFVGHARLDSRDELIDALSSHGEAASSSASSPELVLRSYRLWGEHCVERFLGDFSFAVWDTARQRLFCARDHLGVRPFFYANLSDVFLFSNTLQALRLHPSVPDTLDDLAIADFLLFGHIQDPDRTAFASIRRLPAAHTLILDHQGLKLRRYWTLPITEPIYYRHKQDYVEQFKHLLQLAIRGRARASKIVIFMSGGIDSSTLAAMTLYSGVPRSQLCAFTVTYDWLIPDDERYYAGMVARHLGIPTHFWPADAPGFTQYAPGPPEGLAEPMPDPWFWPRYQAQYRRVAALARTAFYAEGPDNALHYEWRAYLSWLWRNKRYWRLLGDVADHILTHKRIPVLPTLLKMWRSRRQEREWNFPFPSWINPELVARLDLRTRYQLFSSPRRSPHPLRPVAWRSFTGSLWPLFFESLDPFLTQVPMEYRHPYCDLRVVNFMLSVPAIPWCRVKYLLRRTAKVLLPAPVLKRSKTPLRAHPEFRIIEGWGMARMCAKSAETSRYIVEEEVTSSWWSCSPRYFADSRHVALNWWLEKVKVVPNRGEAHGSQRGC